MALLREIGTAKKVISTTALLLISTITILNENTDLPISKQKSFPPFRYNRMTNKKMTEFH